MSVMFHSASKIAGIFVVSKHNGLRACQNRTSGQHNPGRLTSFGIGGSRPSIRAGGCPAFGMVVLNRGERRLGPRPPPGIDTRLELQPPVGPCDRQNLVRRRDAIHIACQRLKWNFAPRQTPAADNTDPHRDTGRIERSDGTKVGTAREALNHHVPFPRPHE